MSRLKLDENLGNREAAILRAAGHDVAMVHEQHLEGAADEDLLAICTAERRGLVTLDLDFANPIRFDPALHAGICVIRQVHGSPAASIIESVHTLAEALRNRAIAGKLWIVAPQRIREYASDASDED